MDQARPSYEALQERVAALTRQLQDHTRSTHELLNSLVDTIYVFDMDTGEPLLWNTAFTRVSGYSDEEIASMKAIESWYSPEDQARAYAGNAKVAAQGKSVLEMDLITKDGRRIPTEYTASRVPFDGHRNCLIAVGRDVSDSRSAELALRYQQMFFNRIIDQNPFPIWISDAQGTLVRANEALLKFLNVTEEQIVGRYNVLEDPNVERAGLLPRFRSVYEQGQTIEFEMQWSAAGSLAFTQANSVTIEGTLFPVFDHNGLLTHAVLTYRDISERLRALEYERKIQEQEKMASIGRIAGKMAHDFNNVLGVTYSYSELLLLNPDLPEAIREDILVIQESAERGREITRNLLLFSKNQEAKYSLFDLNERIGAVLRAMRADLRGVKVSLDYGAGLDAVIADSGLLENAIMNLIQNAVHAMGKTPRPELSVRTWMQEDVFRIDIKDNGCGIPEEHHARVFDPCFTLKGSMDRTGAYDRALKGSGYGLANVKRNVEKHGGRVWFTSAPGQGTVFCVEIPIIQAQISEQDVREQVACPNITGKRILVVEDEPHYGRILYKVLRAFKHDIHLVTDGKMALDYFNKNQYDAVSLDFMLPDMTGMDVYRAMRETNTSVPIVFVSGNFEFMQSMIDLKSNDPHVDHLSKPFRNTEYVNMMHTWLQGPEA